ncbi:MAG: glycosyltransferase [Calditrichota bacterium]
MNTTNLIRDAYREIEPKVSRVYVMPSIPAVSAQNPYLRLFYAPIEDSDIILSSTSRLSPIILFRRILGEKSIVHHHWFECHNLFSMINLIYKLKILFVYRLFGGKLIWTVHNLQPHHQRYRRANKILRNLWSRLPNRLHVHCRAAAREASAHLSVSPERFFVVPHPFYPVQQVEKREAKIDLAKRFPQLENLSAPIVLMQGYIAEYKGIKAVLEILQKHSIHLNLIIAGPVKRYEEAYASKIKELTEDLRNAHYIEGYLEQEDLDMLFNAADYVLLNYQNILHSGGAILAESYDKPIIAPRKGCLMELENARLFSNEEELLKILQEITKKRESDDAA